MAYDYEAIIPYLLDWYDYNARILPWRENPEPYYVWVSEIMLQQTRVEAVKDYFDRFIKALPDVRSLAEAEEEKLMKLWEGLGYYSRARNLHKAARIIFEEYGSKLPADADKLLKLPGIGRYTAGAIASIAFGLPVPAIDGNVLRIAKRLAGSFDDITREDVKKELWEEMNQVMPQKRSGDFNQALMDLGATICLPNGKPLCEKCPLMHLCQAFHQDLVNQIPVKTPKKKRKVLQRTILVMEYQNTFCLHKRADKGLLAGLWELPGLEEKVSLEKLGRLLEEYGLQVGSMEKMGEARHIFTHLEWEMIGYHIDLQNIPDLFREDNSYVWVNREEISKRYTIPSAFAAYTDSLKQTGKE
jgi:A/G-specific adenine glycosylase